MDIIQYIYCSPLFWSLKQKQWQGVPEMGAKQKQCEKEGGRNLEKGGDIVHQFWLQIAYRNNRQQV